MESQGCVQGHGVVVNENFILHIVDLSSRISGEISDVRSGGTANRILRVAHGADCANHGSDGLMSVDPLIGEHTWKMISDNIGLMIMIVAVLWLYTSYTMHRNK